MNKLLLPNKEQALKGRDTPLDVDCLHAVNGNNICAPFPENTCVATFGLGCFWGAERKFWLLNGVYSTAVGYSAGFTPNPTYEEVCSGLTGHNEVVLVVYNPAVITYSRLLKVFFESHNPTQLMQQGNDIGTQYRSGIYTHSEEQASLAKQCKRSYQSALLNARYGDIQTEILPASEFYYAETYHQQYLFKNPNGYCGLGGTGVSCS